MARDATGTQLQLGDAQTTEVFTTVAEVTDISGPNISVGEIDTTSHDNVGWRSYIPTLADGGEVTFEIEYDMTAATHLETTTGLVAVVLGRMVRNWRIVPPGQSKRWNVRGFVSSFEPGYPVGDKQTASITIKVVQAPTVTAQP
jgi:hypothetical protein